MKNTAIKNYYKEINERMQELDGAVRRGDKRAASNLRKEIRASHNDLKQARKSAGKARRNARADRELGLDLMVAY